MASQVFYRKWRSQTLAELVGQQHVTQTLLNALKTGNISHAYLSCGPRGTGKTSTARILAKAINCLTNVGKGEPCNTCDMCKAVTEDRAMDVIEIDAASNRGIDDIRDLREKVNYAPTQARRKVYIIDEFHMLSKDASNALLKTLEEPPPHVVFILATTEAHKVLPTILSRCQHFDFHRHTTANIAAKLTQVCEIEKINIDQPSLNLVARNSTGSMRDAYNLLEQLYTYYGANISFLQVQATLGITGDWRAKEIVKHILQNDISGGMSTMNSVNNDGLDLHQFNRELVDYLRALLLVKTGAPENTDLAAEDVSELKELAGKASLAQVLNAVKLFGQIQMGNSEGSSLPMELALVECYLANEKKASPVETAPSAASIPAKAGIQSAAQPKPAAAPASPSSSLVTHSPIPAHASVQSSPAVSSSSPMPSASQVPSSSPIPAKAGIQPSPLPKSVAPPSTPVPAPTAASSPPAEAKPINEPAPAMVKEGPAKPVSLSSEIERLRLNWKQIIESSDATLRKTNAAALLKNSSKPVSVENDTVVLAFGYELLKNNMEKPEAKRIAEQILSNYLGHSCQISCICDPKKDHLVNLAKKLGGQVTSVEEK